MFFYLGNDCDLLTKQRENLFTDLGWKRQNDVYYKGYCLDYNIDDNIDKILDGDRPQGIYTVIKDTNIFYPRIRPFPIYKKDNILTNLKLDNFIEVPVSKVYKLPKGSKSLDVVVAEIIKILVDNLSKVELNIWCTGGIDSTMLIAIAEYAKLPYTIHVAKPRNFSNIKNFEGTVEEYTSPLIEFCRKNYWAYEFLSNFNNKVITTGFYGDEYFCRTVLQINQLANSIGKEILDVVKPTDYIYYHSHRYKNKIENYVISNAKESSIQNIGCSHVWHLDNTLTFCPLMDKRISENVWSLEVDELLRYAVDATIQKQIITETKADVLLLTDTWKNSPHGRKNFFKNLNKVKLTYCNDIVVH
jgi:hypothetical protein